MFTLGSELWGEALIPLQDLVKMHLAGVHSLPFPLASLQSLSPSSVGGDSGVFLNSRSVFLTVFVVEEENVH